MSNEINNDKSKQPMELSAKEINIKLDKLLKIHKPPSRVDEIHRAVLKWRKAFRSKNPWLEDIKSIYGDWYSQSKRIACYSFDVYIWDHRHGFPWRTELEAHVASFIWRATPWATSDKKALSLAPLLRDKGLGHQFVNNLCAIIKAENGSNVENERDGSLYDFINATPKQRATAALNTLLEHQNSSSKEEQTALGTTS